jgi:replication factor C small subunit
VILNEKYRPKTLNQVAGQDHVISYLKEFIKKKDIPHMLFCGSAGTGKTTTAIAIARELYGDGWKEYFLEINGSDETGVDTIRTKVKSFAQVGIVGETFKILFIDEADMLSPNSQHALRRIIEMYSGRTRFIFSCNYPNKIIDPIKDRCVVFRFRGLKPLEMKLFLDNVVREEGIDITKAALHTLCTLSNGSLRRALNTLEKLKLGNVTNINEETIYNAIHYVNDDHVRMLLASLHKGDIEQVEGYVDALLYEKVYEPEEIIESLRRLLKDSTVLPRELKLNALMKIGDLEFRIAEGASADIQLKTYVDYLISLYDKLPAK